MCKKQLTVVNGKSDLLSSRCRDQMWSFYNMQGFMSRFFKKQWFCFWKNDILLFSLLTVVTKAVPVHSYHSWLSFLFLLCLVINLKVIEPHFSHALPWSRWMGMAVSERLRTKNFCYWFCALFATLFLPLCRRQGTGASRNADTWSHLFWFAIEATRDFSWCTGACKGPGNTGL